MNSLSAFQPVIDALPMEPFALQALLVVESFCLVAMVVLLIVFACQLFYGCMRAFTVASLAVCCGIASCGVWSFVTLDWQPGLIGTGIVVALHLMGHDPLGRKAYE